MQQSSILKNRILEYLDLKGISHNKFYTEATFSHGSLSRDGGVTEDNLQKFVAFAIDVNLVWFLTGKGTILKTEDYETKDNPTAASSYDDAITPFQNKPEVNSFLEKQIILLTEQNQNLAKQNQELMIQLSTLVGQVNTMMIQFGSAMEQNKQLIAMQMDMNKDHAAMLTSKEANLQDPPEKKTDLQEAV